MSICQTPLVLVLFFAHLCACGTSVTAAASVGGGVGGGVGAADTL